MPMKLNKLEKDLVAYVFGYKRRGFWKGHRVRALRSEFEPALKKGGLPETVGIQLSMGGGGYYAPNEDIRWDNPELNNLRKEEGQGTGCGCGFPGAGCVGANCSCGIGEDCRVCQ
jgi:hypothetical protein